VGIRSFSGTLNDQSKSAPIAATVPVEIASILESTFQRLLAEATFADAWPRPELSVRSETISEVGFHVILPILSPWKGRILLAGDEETVRDLAAGFHSIPDAMVDKAISLDFLAELATLLVRDLFCVSENPVDVQEPVELEPAQARALWEEAAAARTVLGCNQGRILAALLVGP
jgi:hypothetical protein